MKEKITVLNQLRRQDELVDFFSLPLLAPRLLARDLSSFGTLLGNSSLDLGKVFVDNSSLDADRLVSCTGGLAKQKKTNPGCS
jgi:hypothetical protein